MRALLVTIAALAGTACGPSIDGSSEASDGSGASTTEGNDSTGGVTITSTTTGADTTDTTDTDPTSADASSADTGEFGELLPAEAVITEAVCDDNDIMSVMIEGYFDVAVDRCVPPPDVPPSDMLIITIDAWSQVQQIFEVGPGQVAQVTYEGEPMVGTLDLTIWAPGHPDAVILDVVGETAILQGTLDLVPCTVVLDDCFPG